MTRDSRLAFVNGCWRNIRVAICLVTVAVGLPGCGSHAPSGRIAGKVTFQGKPLPEGLVSLRNMEKGVNLTALVDTNGGYRLTTAKGATIPLGTYQVCVCPKPQILVGVGAKPERVGPHPEIPEKYRKFEKSPLSVKVVEGENVFDIDMTP